MSDGDLLERASAWADGDPDPTTADAMRTWIEARDTESLHEAMSAPLRFGTAGIRGVVGPGSGRMNRAVVIKTSAGLGAYLEEAGRGDRPVVVGFDARPSSRAFAEDTIGVLAAMGFAVAYFAEVTPTPLVSFAAKHLGAAAAVVVTASHNPPADNGYKVYGANAAQIIPPEDLAISEAIDRVGAASQVPRVVGIFTDGHPNVSLLGPEIFDAYYAEVDATRPNPQRSDLTLVYTPIHGVGGKVLVDMFARAGHTGLNPVPEQFVPDGTFPTVNFPNPEEEGALDLALALGDELSADAIIANDPDADRLAAAIPSSEGWRMLTGNELGALLGDYVLANWPHNEKAIVGNSIVSSPLLASIAEGYGAHHEATLTGFKWIVNACLELEDRGVGRFAFGYEEALGYTIGKTVPDKDGLSAALIFADLLAEEHQRGRTLVDRLHEIWLAHGLWVSTQKSMVRPGEEGQQEIADAVRRLGESPPGQVSGIQVTSITDYREGADRRPRWLGQQDLIEMRLGGEGRALVRPSGTEPKLKVYVDLVGAAGERPDEKRTELLARADDVATGLASWLAS